MTPVKLEKISSAISEAQSPGTNQSLVNIADNPLIKELNELNKIHAFLLRGGKATIVYENIDPDGNLNVEFLSPIDFVALYANRRIQVRGPRGKWVEVQVAKEWFTWEGRREYKGLIFSPEGDVPGYYNLFRGFAVTPKPGDWSRMRNHIKKVICGGKQEFYLYLLRWMAYIVQKKGVPRPEVAIVLLGRQGTGKGILLSNFGAIFGDHFLQLYNSDQLTGRFNSHLESCMVLFLDEGIWGGDKAAEGVLKGIITEKYLQIEPKGKDSYRALNHVNLLIASNNDWVIPAGIEERRFLVLLVSAEHCQDHTYFEAIAEEMDNSGREAMLYDLLAMDLSEFNPRQVPRTGALLNQIVNTFNSVEKYWFEKLRNGHFGSIWEFITTVDSKGPERKSAWEGWIPSQEIHQDYKKFAQDIGDRRPLIDSKFFTALKRLCPSLTRERGPQIGAVRPWGYLIPALEECRAEFEHAVGLSLDWE